MWARLNNKLNNIFYNSTKENKQNSAKNIIQTTINELEKAIQKTEKLYQNTLENQQEIQSKIRNYQQKLHKLYQEALQSNKNGQKDLAAAKFSQRANIEQQITQYKVIYQSILKTLLQLEKQIEKLKLKLTETQSKRAMLSVKLENAQNQKDLSAYLSELDESGEFSNYEEEITKIEVETSLVNDISVLEDEFESLEEQDMDSFKTALEEEERKIQAQKSEQQFKKVNQIFSSQSSKEKELKLQKKKELEAKKQALLNQFMNKQHLPSNAQENIINDFFDAQEGIENPVEKTDEISENLKNEILEKFSNSNGKTSNQKRIDDFFNE